MQQIVLTVLFWGQREGLQSLVKLPHAISALPPGRREQNDTQSEGMGCIQAA